MVEPYKDILKMYNRNPLYKIRYNREFRKVENQFYEDISRIKDIELKDYTIKELDKIALACSKKEIKIITLLDRVLNLTFDLNGPLMTINI